jgi:hypothetical protein
MRMPAPLPGGWALLCSVPGQTGAQPGPNVTDHPEEGPADGLMRRCLRFPGGFGDTAAGTGALFEAAAGEGQDAPAGVFGSGPAGILG